MTHRITRRSNNIASFAIFVLVSSSCEAFVPVNTHSNFKHAAYSQQRILPSSPDVGTSEIHSELVKERKISSLQMHPATAGVSAISGAVSGGIFAGGLHAIAGPDHIAALLPQCSGKRWYLAGRIGALWGLGHGISATIVGITAFFLKNRLSGGVVRVLSGASSLMDLAVGLSLVAIGVLGLREALEWKVQLQEVQPKTLSAAANDVACSGSKSVRSVVFNGLLHGFSWDGAPSLAPAIAVATWRGNLTFLLSYAMGTMAAMAATTTLIGEGTRKAGELFDRPNIPQQFSFVSSIVAILVGCVWVGLAGV